MVKQKKALIGVVMALLMLMASAQVWGASLGDSLSEVEVSLYGQVETATTSLLPRLQKLEVDIWGSAQTGDIVSRTNNLKALATVGTGGASLIMKLNCSEWQIFGTLTSGTSLRTRLETIEKDVFGSVQVGPLGTRIQSLLTLIWPSGVLETAAVALPVNLPVKVRLQTGINSKTARVGDEVKYTVSESVVLEGKVVIPSGARGTGKVISIKTAGSFGTSGDVVVDFGKIVTLDGKALALVGTSKNTDTSSTSEIAAGASLVGLVALGPVGVGLGLFVKGQDLDVPAGTELTLLIAQQSTVTGLSLSPSR